MIRSEVFTISRSQLMRAASMQYLRRMWPVFVAFPVFGLLALFLGPNPLIRAIGILALAWPFSIPARALIATRSKAKQLMRPTWVSLEDRVLYFHDEEGGGMKLPLDDVRRLDKRDGLYVFETRSFNFAILPASALGPSMASELEAIAIGA